MKRLLAIPLAILVLLPTQATSQVASNSADRLLFWMGCRIVSALTDAELDRWKARGVDGFVCTHQHLRDMGGTQNFTADPNHPLSTSDYELQRSIRDSKIVSRAHARGMKLYLSAYLVNYYNDATPLKEWFDDAGWSGTVLPKLGDVAGAAELLGFDGLAFDQELYGKSEAAQRWPWNYVGNIHTEAQVRAKARERGQQVMAQILEAFPGVELLTYSYNFAGDWNSVVQKRYNNLENLGANALFIDWYSGLASAEGYSSIRLINTNFHKTKAPAATWDIAMQYEANHLLSLFSRTFPNWSYAASRVHPTPFSWIDAGSSLSTYDDAKPPAEVEVQLAAMRKWGTGGEFLNFAHQDIRSFDYGPYVAGMQSASTPAVVDSTPPTLSVATSAGGGSSVDLSGVVKDDMAVRSVSWSNDQGGSGAASTTWRILSGDYRVGYEWQTDWQASVPLRAGPNVISVTVEDIKGLRTTSTVTVEGGGTATTTTTTTTTRPPTTTTSSTTTTSTTTTSTTTTSTTTTTVPKKGPKQRPR